MQAGGGGGRVGAESGEGGSCDFRKELDNDQPYIHQFDNLNYHGFRRAPHKRIH